MRTTLVQTPNVKQIILKNKYIIYLIMYEVLNGQRRHIKGKKDILVFHLFSIHY